MAFIYPRASQINSERSCVREQRLQNVFSALTRAASLDREAAQEIACWALKVHPELWRNALGVAIAQDGPFAYALEDLIHSGVELPLRDILNEIPAGHDALQGVTLAAIERLVDSAQSDTEEQLHWQSVLTKQLLEVDEWDKALASADKAVSLCSVLSQSSPSAYAAQFAEALTLLGRARNELGLTQGAIDALREAVRLYRELAKSESSSYKAKLADALNELALSLRADGNPAEVLEARLEALRLHLSIAGSASASETDEESGDSDDLFLSEWGKEKIAEVLQSAREDVEACRTLALASPQAYTPALAGALNNLANCLSGVGERGEALRVAREAVRLRRVLAKASPQAYMPDLARSLNNLANHLSAVGEHGEALVVAREAVELYRALAEASPQAYTPDLVGALNNLANILSEVGKQDEALETFVEGFDCFSPAVRARLLVARATWRDDGVEAGDVVAAAREADSTDDPVLLGPVRRMIARSITDVGIMDTGLPRWATVDAESATSRIEGWLECSDLAQGVAFLEAQWSSPSASEREALAALAELYVDLPPVAALATLVERIANDGIQAVTTGLRIHHRVQVLARDWYEAHTGGQGARFLREHMRADVGALREAGGNDAAMKTDPAEWDRDLSDPAMRSTVVDVLAAELPDTEATRMGLLLELADLSDPGTAYEVYGSDEGAEDSLRHFLESHNWRAMVAVLGVRPGVADSAHGRISALLAAAACGESTERLRELYEYANEAMDAIDRRHFQALLVHERGTDQCPKEFSDLLRWVKA